MPTVRNLCAVVTAVIVSAAGSVASGAESMAACVVVEGNRDRHGEVSALVREAASALGVKVIEPSSSGEVIAGKASGVELRILAPFEYHAAVIQALAPPAAELEASTVMETLGVSLTAANFSMGTCEQVLGSRTPQAASDKRRGG